jgi:hypothetical protein
MTKPDAEYSYEENPYAQGTHDHYGIFYRKELIALTRNEIQASIITKALMLWMNGADIK